jgi:CMP-N-acetylneuraminic acid synthetase
MRARRRKVELVYSTNGCIYIKEQMALDEAENFEDLKKTKK